MAKIIIADDHKIFRNGLKMLLEAENENEVIAESSNGVELLKQLKVYTPDIIFLDIKMPELDGIKTSKKIIKEYPKIKIIVLTMFGDEIYFREMEKIGTHGFILKDSESEELEMAITSVLNDKKYVSQDFLQKLYFEKEKQKEKNHPVLTKRELEVLQYIAKGLTNNEIAKTLSLSVRTIEKHRSNLLLKTETDNSIKLVTFAIKNNFIRLQ